MTPAEAFLSKHDRRSFDPWRKALAVVATVFTIATIAIVFANGLLSASPTTAAAESPGKDAYFTSSTTPPRPDETDRPGSGSLSALWEVI